MRRALIGHTGFVGSNLDAPGRFVAHYNSANIETITGERFDEVWCAGVQAVKWWANKNPEADWEGIRKLLTMLERVEVTRFVLVSTVDVYATPTSVDEDSPTGDILLHPYGEHRLRVERFVERYFAEQTTLRLPGLYGNGLKKNLIFDVLSGRPLDGYHAASTFQFYHLDDLWADAQRGLGEGLTLLNLAVEPVTVGAVVKALTGRPFTNETEAPPIAYDMQTLHAATLGRSGRYLQTADETLARIARFGASFAAPIA